MRRALVLILVALIVVEGLRSTTYLSPQYTEFKVRERYLSSAWRLLNQLSVKNLSEIENSSFGYEVLVPTPDGGLHVRCGA